LILSPASMAAISVCSWLRLVRNTCMYGKDLSLKPGWSPIRELVTPANSGTQNTFVAEAKHRSTPGHKYYNL